MSFVVPSLDELRSIGGTEHNHPLSSPNEVHLLRSHRHISGGDLAQAKTLRHVGVKTCKVVDYIGDQYMLKLYEFVLQIDRALRNIRTTEAEDELTIHLRSLEKHDVDVFSIKKIICRSSEANVANNDSWGTSILADLSEQFSFYNNEVSYEIETQNKCGSSSQACFESIDHF
ncbi:hypothetical protein WN943_026831 [Citrus x changshan-huyou]